MADRACFVVTHAQEFLLKHNIHVVALSPEYDTPDDQFYAGARELGMLPYLCGLTTRR
jgi:hypothetical protein